MDSCLRRNDLNSCRLPTAENLDQGLSKICHHQNEFSVIPTEWEGSNQLNSGDNVFLTSLLVGRKTTNSVFPNLFSQSRKSL